jgi:hypothetical protein
MLAMISKATDKINRISKMFSESLNLRIGFIGQEVYSS